MAKKSSIERNAKRERLAKKYAGRGMPLMDLIQEARLKLAQLPRNASPVRVRLRCAMTGRPRGCYRKFKLSRIALRELAAIGQIPGMTKSSW